MVARMAALHFDRCPIRSVSIDLSVFAFIKTLDKNERTVNEDIRVQGVAGEQEN